LDQWLYLSLDSQQDSSGIVEKLRFHLYVPMQSLPVQACFLLIALVAGSSVAALCRIAM
jgi:alpha-D-ribose 1-methylphosphonate 5-triphosphate synthase subunit PhnH